MSLYPESALIAAGFLRERCCEAINLECPECGTVAQGLSLADCSNGMQCETCGKWSQTPRLKCGRCKETLAVTPEDGERECLSIRAYRKGDCAPVFAPEEALWVFKQGTAGTVKVAAESELRRRFESGDLDSSVLVRGLDQPDFIKADSCPEFREVARTSPAPEQVPRPRQPPERSLTPPARPPAVSPPRTTTVPEVSPPALGTTLSWKGRLILLIAFLVIILVVIGIVALNRTSITYTVQSQDGYLIKGDTYIANLISGTNFLWPGYKVLCIKSPYFVPVTNTIHVVLGKNNDLGPIIVNAQAIRFMARGSRDQIINTATWMGKPISSGEPVIGGTGEFILALDYHEQFRTNLTILPGQLIDLGMIRLQLKTTVIEVVSSDSNARFNLTGPETLSGKGSMIFSNVICGIYTIVANMDGLDFGSKIDATSKSKHLVEYRWQNLKVRVESPQELNILFGKQILGKNTARIRAPVNNATIVLELRGKGTTKVKQYEPGGYPDNWTEVRYECIWHGEVTLPAGQYIGHHPVELHAFVWGAGDHMGKTTYELFVEPEAER